jgi:ABC-type lipoprotein export system ATPase subunit
MSPILVASRIRRAFDGRSILDGLDMEISRGEFIAVVGKSGVGKSTLLGVLGTHDREFTGELLIDGRDVGAMDDGELAGVRRELLGFVFQDFYLLPHLTALENVLLPAVFSGRDVGEATRQAEEVLGRLSVRMDSTPTSVLSRGERQRVAVARGLVNGPDLLLADEPSASLDEENERVLFDLLDGLRRDRGFAMVAVIHSTSVLGRADRILELSQGRLHEVS